MIHLRSDVKYIYVAYIARHLLADFLPQLMVEQNEGPYKVKEGDENPPPQLERLWVMKQTQMWLCQCVCVVHSTHTHMHTLHVERLVIHANHNYWVYNWT